MATLGEFLGREAGQKRRKWLDETVGNTLSYFLGPTGIDDRLNAVAMLNPVNDVGEAMQNSRVMMDASRSGRERFDAGVDMATNMAAVLAPVVAGKMAGGADEAADVVDALLGFGGPTREAATDYAKRFAGDEAGNIRLPIGDAVETRGSDILDLLRNGRAGEVTDEMLDLGDPTLNARLNEYLFNNYDLPMDEASRMARAREMGFDTDAPLFHGTTADFTEFRNVGDRITAMGDGHYFSPDAEKAGSYAGENGNIVPAAVRGEVADWQNPPQRLREVLAASDSIDADYSAGFGSIKREQLDMTDVNAARARFKELQDQTSGRWHDRAKARLVDGDNGDVFVEWMEPGFDNASPSDLFSISQHYDQNVWKRAGFDGAKYGDETVVSDPRNIRSRFARFDPRLSHLRNLSAGAAGLGILGGANMQNDDNQPLRAYLGL